eukprot:TRINITY_DN1170_c0_g3_i2.p1 TRINITY_DN1170_c0_g3~~TRINITY_DN1170_c0_g3_i2.p1  ORF type:complete len:531 (-),score=85.02 TRINITY_DN1170_c0_g3_i2:428-1951(-)
MGQLAGSLLASGLAHTGPVLLLLAACLMEAAGWCALRISDDHLMAPLHLANPSRAFMPDEEMDADLRDRNYDGIESRPPKDIGSKLGARGGGGEPGEGGRRFGASRHSDASTEAVPLLGPPLAGGQARLGAQKVVLSTGEGSQQLEAQLLNSSNREEGMREEPRPQQRRSNHQQQQHQLQQKGVASGSSLNDPSEPYSSRPDAHDSISHASNEGSTTEESNRDDVLSPRSSLPRPASSTSPLHSKAGGSASKRSASVQGKENAAKHAALARESLLPSPSKMLYGRAGDGSRRRVTRSLVEGLRLIVQSSYLLHVCSFLLLTAIVSSFFYFERAAVVAGTSDDPVVRRKLLANINSLSAVATVTFQLTLTGRLLAYAGVPAALCAAPLTALLGMAAIALRPTAMVVGVSEALRKVVTYVLTRPGREILFTVITREEKYKAKLTIDTLVQRVGDAAAAGVFRVLGTSFKLGPAGVAAAAMPLCCLWIVSGFSLGMRQQAMARASVPHHP